MRTGHRNVASLFVIRGHDQGRRFLLTEETTQVGRDVSNPIQLHDTEVSRRHAEFRRVGQAISLHDLNSSNGCFVNGRKVSLVDLSSGDQVQLGGTVLLFTGPADASSHGLSQRVNIIARDQPGDESRIVRSMSQAEGSQLLLGDTGPTASPWLARARSNLQIMYRTALAVSHTLDIDQLLERILQLIFEWIEADRGCIMLTHPQSRKLEPKASRHRGGAPAGKISISQTILDYVIERNEGVLTSDAREDQRWNPAASIVRLGIREAICVPMRGRYDTVGIIYVDTSTPAEHATAERRQKFTEEHLKLMVAIGHQAALAIEDTHYYSAMVQAERMAAIGQTIATLSHHIKNILQGIRGGSYLIEEGLSKHDEAIVRKGWSFVERNQDKISNLVMDMLSFSKERVPDMQTADLNETIADVVELAQARAQELNVHLRLQAGSGIPPCSFDPDGVHRAVLNVVANAIDACAVASGEESPQGAGQVLVRTEHDADAQKLRVFVDDNGVGIPEQDLEAIFAPFHSSKGSRGTGLGLPVSRKILREHGGDILVQSQLGQGSRFILELPIHPPEAIRHTLTGRLEDFETDE